MDAREEELRRKRAGAVAALRSTGGAVVALSGGVDSAVLLLLALEALGPGRVLAVTGRSGSLAEEDFADAEAVAAQLGAPFRSVDTRELDRPGYRENRGDRCFHCREELFETLRRIARQAGLPAVAYGAIRDDLAQDRPGMAAATRAGVLAPLLEAGFTKEDVRRVACAAGLPVRDKPAAPCLSSRIPVGTEVTPERLRQVESAEKALRKLGFVQLRVRHHGDVGRVELDPTGLDRLGDPSLRAAVSRAVRAAGFRFAAVELEPFRSGSLDPGTPLPVVGTVKTGS